MAFRDFLINTVTTVGNGGLAKIGANIIEIGANNNIIGKFIGKLFPKSNVSVSSHAKLITYV